MKGLVLRIVCLLALLLQLGPAARTGARDELTAARARFDAAREAGPFDLPMVVRASLEAGRIEGEVEAIVEHPFARVSESLRRPEVWCDVLTLHLNVKSCEPERTRDGRPELRIATARKHYVSPSGRRPLRYRLDVAAPQAGFVEASLHAEKGPLGVRDMIIEVAARPEAGDASFVRLRYGYSESWAARMATRTYLATLGRRKIGFTVTGTTAEGEPVYVGGAEGAVERNAVRYHLALVAYFDTLPVHEAGRFEARIARWYDLTDRYRAQLYEMPRERYLAMKGRERRDMEAQAKETQAKDDRDASRRR